MSSHHAKLTANTLRDAATFVLEQSTMIENLDREKQAIIRLRDALVQIASVTTEDDVKAIAVAALRPGGTPSQIHRLGVLQSAAPAVSRDSNGA